MEREIIKHDMPDIYKPYLSGDGNGETGEGTGTGGRDGRGGRHGMDGRHEQNDELQYASMNTDINQRNIKMSMGTKNSRVVYTTELGTITVDKGVIAKANMTSAAKVTSAAGFMVIAVIIAVVAIILVNNHKKI